MFGEVRTVFVVGAGASIPYGFPSAAQMTEQLKIDLAQRDHPLTKVIQERLGPEFSRLRTDVLQLTKSIDEHAYYNPDSIEGLKYAIAYYILKAERSARVGPVSKYDSDDGEATGTTGNPLRTDNWLGYLFNCVTSPGYSRGDVNLAFVTFNYDRLIEHYFTTKAEHLHRDDGPFRCSEFLESISIVHVHGSVGPLGALGIRRYSYQDVVGFGEYDEPDEVVVDHSAGYLSMAYEDQSVDSRKIQRARAFLHQADRIIFLGCAYHRFALERLDWKNTILRDDVEIYGTAWGLEQGVRKWLYRKSEGRLHGANLLEMKCESLLCQLDIDH